MKKLLLPILFALGALCLSSCYHHQVCNTYTDNSTPQIEKVQVSQDM